MNDDLISRQTAIEALEELKELDYELYVRTGCCHLLEDHWDYVIRRYKEIIKETPSIQPKTGRWKPLQHLGKEYTWLMECSCCGKGRIGSNIALTYNYCPYCGAKMEGEVK